MIIWKSMQDPELADVAKAGRAIVFRFGNHLATVFSPDGNAWHSTYDNRPIDFPGAAKPTAWGEISDIPGMDVPPSPTS